MDKLGEARKKIDEIDRDMAKLFEKRMKAVEDVASYKKDRGLPIYDKSREDLVVNKNLEYVEDKVIGEYYVGFIKNVMNLSTTYQERLNSGIKVAYSGVEGAYGFIAAKKMYPNANYVSFNDFLDAYNAVINGDCDVAVLPIENSYAGDVDSVTDLMFSGSLFVNRVYNLSVSHNLIANVGTNISDVKKVFSHPQAIAQCAEYLKGQNFEVVPYSNTAMAAKLVAESGDKTIAAIASAESAEYYGLNIIAKNINSSGLNTTRFGAFSKTQSTPNSTGKKMESRFILMFTVANSAGALAKTIDIIGAHGYNMKTLRSRPMKELLWNYYFFVEAEGNINTEDGREMMRQLSVTCDRLKLVGSYIDESKI